MRILVRTVFSTWNWCALTKKYPSMALMRLTEAPRLWLSSRSATRKRGLAKIAKLSMNGFHLDTSWCSRTLRNFLSVNLTKTRSVNTLPCSGTPWPQIWGLTMSRWLSGRNLTSTMAFSATASWQKAIQLVFALFDDRIDSWIIVTNSKITKMP